MARKKAGAKKYTVIIIAAVIVFSAVITHFAFGGFDKAFEKTGLRGEAVSDEITVSFLDVGQADCTLITCGDTVIMVDAGEAGSAQTVINYLRNAGVEKIDCCIATHPHSDHIGAFPAVIEQFEVGDVIMPEIPKKIIPTTTVYKRFLSAVSSDNVEQVLPAAAGETYSYGEVDLEILGPVTKYDDLNAMSVVTKVTYGETSLLVTGDAEKESEQDILARFYSDCSADLLKVGHHGSRTSTCEEWLAAVNPSFGVISCGEDNDYGHPHKQTLDRLENSGVKYYRTDLLGNVIFKSDGKKFTLINNDIDF